MTPYIVITLRTFSGALPTPHCTWAVLVAGFFTFPPIYLQEEAVCWGGSGSLQNTYATNQKTYLHPNHPIAASYGYEVLPRPITNARCSGDVAKR